MDAPDLSFPPAMRFHDARDFSRVFNRQQKSAGRHVVVLVRRQDAKGGAVPKPRLGVMVPAKAVPSAVRRHQLKRWVRELFRTKLAATMPGMEMVVLLRADPPEDAHAAFDAEVTEQLRRAHAAQAQPGQQRRRGDHQGGGRPGGKPGGPRDGRPGAAPSPAPGAGAGDHAHRQRTPPAHAQGQRPAKDGHQDQRSGTREQRPPSARTETSRAPSKRPPDGPRASPPPPPGPAP